MVSSPCLGWYSTELGKITFLIVMSNNTSYCHALCHVMSIIFTISDMNYKKLFLLLLMFFFDVSCNIIEVNKDRKMQVKVC